MRVIKRVGSPLPPFSRMRGTPKNSGTKGGIGINSKPKILVRKGGLEPPRFYPPDPKLSRFAGVSEAGARRRNPERSRRIPMILVRKGDSNPHGFTRQILS